MYTASFGLRCPPFEDRADSAFFFPAAQHEEAIAAMQYEAQHGTGVGLILGETGTGKTILVRALTRRLSESQKVVVVTVPGNGAVDLLRETCKGFGVSLPSSLQDARGLARLRRHLSRDAREGGRPVLIIDQAEHLSPGDLNDLESLLELQDDRGRLLRVVIAAHPRFRTLLEQPAFGRLRQLAFTEHRLESLSQSDVAGYIRHRLSVAGAADSEIFSDDAIGAVFARSNGIPRVVNQICSVAMLAAYGEKETRVTRRHVDGRQQDVETIPDLIQTADFEFASGHTESKRIDSPSWDDSSRRYEIAAEAAQAKLVNLIQNAERVVEGLKRKVPQATAAVDQAERKVDQLLGDAREQILALESRLSAATRRAEQAAAQVERAEHAFTRAEQIETRLAAFADQLAEQMDNVQSRVAEIMKFAAPLDDARSRLEGAVRQSDAARTKIEQAAATGNALLVKQGEQSLKDLQGAIASLTETTTRKMRTSWEALQKEASGLMEKSERSAKDTAQEYQQRVTQTVQSAQSQIETSVRAASEKIAQADQKIAEVHDAVQSGQQAIQSATQKASRTAEDVKHAGEQARHEAQNAQEAADRLRTLHMESTQTAARIAADTATARQVAENLTGLISCADMKISQLASTQAAVTHLHERMGKMLLSAHPLVERADAAVSQLDERLTRSDKAQTQLGETATEIASHIERANQAAARAAHESKTAQDSAHTASQISQRLESIQGHASRDIVSLQELLAKSTDWLTRMDTFNTSVIAAAQTSEKLSAVVASGESLIREIPTQIEIARQHQTSLQEISESLKGLLERHDQARRDSHEATERMGRHLQNFHQSLERTEGDLKEHQRRVSVLQSEFQQVAERSDEALKVAAQVQGAVENAQSQSENLERVCVAVRKVFSGLSQASLNARNQAQELEQFVIQANHTAGTLQQWLDKVRLQLDGIMGIRSAPIAGAPVADIDTPVGTLEREAEMLVENEPGSASAHLVDGGLDAAMTQPYPSQAREIAQLIEKARKSKSGEIDVELAAGPVR